jgi:hypothetical protein
VLVLEGQSGGSVTFDECDRMTEVMTFDGDWHYRDATGWVYESAQPAKAVEGHLAELERRFGAPARVNIGAADDERMWENPSTRLKARTWRDEKTGLPRWTERYSPVGVMPHVWRTPCPPR